MNYFWLSTESKKGDRHMDVSQLVQQKLNELRLEQRELANAAEVTESYISQLLSRKKMPQCLLRRTGPTYYYRELQTLRDPLHFRRK